MSAAIKKHLGLRNTSVRVRLTVGRVGRLMSPFVNTPKCVMFKFRVFLFQLWKCYTKSSKMVSRLDYFGSTELKSLPVESNVITTKMCNLNCGIVERILEV